MKGSAVDVDCLSRAMYFPWVRVLWLYECYWAYTRVSDAIYGKAAFPEASGTSSHDCAETLTHTSKV